MARSIFTALAAVSLAATIHAAHHSPAQGRYGRDPGRTIEESTTVLEALVQTGPDAEAWAPNVVNTGPARVMFRWRTEYEPVGDAEWEISESTLDWQPVSRGKAGLAADKKHGAFDIDFAQIVGGKSQRPLQYFIRVVTFKAQRRAVATSDRGLSRTSDQAGRATASPPRTIRQRETIGVPSQALPVTYVTPGDMTRFTRQGMNPGLLTSLPVEIALSTLTIEGEGGAEDPYLLVVAAFADGTTIIPELDVAAGTIRFTNSRVRLASAERTHENVAGANVDVGIAHDIPADTGRFATTLRPIGVQFQSSLTTDQMTELRRQTRFGLLVIGMEEDALPSTEVIDQTRADLLAALQTELDNVVRSITLDISDFLDPQSDSIQLPNLERAVRDIAGELRERLLDRAMERGLDEFAENLIFLGFPTVVIAPGAINIDDYIGSRSRVFSYEQLLNAGAEGIPIEMQLNQAWDGLPRYLQPDTTESIWYRVRGHVRIRP